jgi:hypothetical protein
MYLHPITGMSNIVSRPNNVRQTLNSLNRLAVYLTLAPSLDNTYSMRIQKHGLEHHVANG